jgi:hypothetical protein
MIDVPTNIFDFSFIKLFSVLIAIVYLIYRFQLIKLIFEAFSNRRSGESKNESDRLKFSKLQNELDEIINRDNIRYSPETAAEFHLQEVVSTDNESLVHLSVAGAPITIKNILSKDFDLISLEPKELLNMNQSFYFRFSLVNPDNKTVRFIILYEDRYAVKHTKEYILFIREKFIEELK